MFLLRPGVSPISPWIPLGCLFSVIEVPLWAGLAPVLLKTARFKTLNLHRWFVSQQETDDLNIRDSGNGNGTPAEENSGDGGGSSDDRGEHAPEGQRVEGEGEGDGEGLEGVGGTEDQDPGADEADDESTPLTQQEDGGATRESGEEEETADWEGDPAAIETIKNLLLMVPVDLEKLRNLAWEKGGYQVGVGWWWHGV